MFAAIAKLIPTIIQIAVTVFATAICGGNVYCGYLAAGVVSTMFTGMSGGSISQALRAGFIAMATAAAFNFIGNETAMADGSHKLDFGSSNYFENVAGHAAVGCLTAVASGGKCGAGAAGAAVGAAGAPFLQGLNMVSGTAASAVLGGLGSVAAGGKFADGAVTASFGYLFNATQYSVSGGATAFWLVFGVSGTVTGGISVPDNWKDFGEYQIFAGIQGNSLAGVGAYGGYGIGGSVGTSDGALPIASAAPVVHAEGGVGYGVSVQGSIDVSLSKASDGYVLDERPTVGFPVAPRVGVGIGAYVGGGFGGNITFASPTVSQMRNWFGSSK